MDDVTSRHSSFADVLYMVVPGVLLSFLPGINGLLGGIIGGFRAASVRHALSAGLVAALAVPATVGLLGLLSRDGFSSYFFFGLGFWGFALVTALGYLAGSLLGAASAGSSHLVRLPAWSRRRPHRRSR
jgi:hypothetical protein